jgi:hypothetical protein
MNPAERRIEVLFNFEKRHPQSGPLANQHIIMAGAEHRAP